VSEVRDNPARQRFELDADGSTAFATYKLTDGVITLIHTEVPQELRGRGIGSRLVGGVLDLVRAQGLKAVVLCPFIKAYISKHPEYANLLK
jgi:predicted GNAT family acetyltransferase